MIMPSSRTVLLAASAALLTLGSATLWPAAPAHAAMPVFDATNYAQNLLQAARALEQINHQVQSLQNEARMLEGLARNLKTVSFPQLDRIKSAMAEIDSLMAKAKGISFDVNSLDQRFRQLYPDAARSGTVGSRVAEARARVDDAMDSFRHSMAVQAEVVGQISEDARLLSELAGRSQDAEGALQAQQSTNQLLALAAKQQLQLQQLLAAHYRSEDVERSRALQSEAEAREATRRFLGTGKVARRGN